MPMDHKFGLVTSPKTGTVQQFKGSKINVQCWLTVTKVVFYLDR
jgi:hypothetical protein